MSSISGITPPPGKHYFHGSWNPTTGHRDNNETFSVAVFQWWANAEGKCKRLPCIIRVKGRVDAPDRVYTKALELCLQLDAGGRVSAKSVTA